MTRHGFLAVHSAALCAALCISTVAEAETPSRRAPDWDALSEVERIEIVTHDEDGDVRETTIWFAVVDGQGFVRSGESARWSDNVVRDPNVALRIERVEYPLVADFIEDDALRERVVAAFREKYGWTDGFLHFLRVRGDHPRIMHMLPR
jgi:hypothetical protein